MSSEHNFDIVPAVQWHEGMLLGPQHFQQQELRLEQILSHQFRLSSPCYWGILNFKIDPIVLPDGLVRVLWLDAVMPDGTFIHYVSGEYDGLPPLELDLRPHKELFEIGAPATIFLCLAQRLPDQSPILSDLPRYTSMDGRAIKDMNTDDNSIFIPRLVPRVFLYITGKEPPERAVGFPILKVSFTHEAFSETPFTPPSFWIHKASSLWEKGASLAQSVREKVSYLSEKWHNQVGTPMLQETSTLLRPLFTILPDFETLIHGPSVSPYTLHQKLCQLLGILATLRLSQIPPILPTYNHNDIDGTITPIFSLIQQCLASVEQHHITVPFEQKGRLFSLRLHKSYSTQILYVGLRAPKGMTEGELETWMNDAIITSDSGIEHVRSLRITGAKRRMLSRTELEELMPSRGVLIFEIIGDETYILFDQNLNILNPADSPEKRPSEINLYLRSQSD